MEHHKKRVSRLSLQEPSFGKTKKIKVWENGETECHIFNINPKDFRNWYVILSHITEMMHPHFGYVKKLIQLSSRKEVTSFKELNPKQKYIAMGMNDKLKEPSKGYKTPTEIIREEKKSNEGSPTSPESGRVSHNWEFLKQTEKLRNTVVYVTLNGSRLHPQKVVFKDTEIEDANLIGSYCSNILGIPDGILRFSTIYGRILQDPRDFQHGYLYVAIPFGETFVQMDYMELFNKNYKQIKPKRFKIPSLVIHPCSSSLSRRIRKNRKLRKLKTSEIKKLAEKKNLAAEPSVYAIESNLSSESYMQEPQRNQTKDEQEQEEQGNYEGTKCEQNTKDQKPYKPSYCAYCDLMSISYHEHDCEIDYTHAEGDIKGQEIKNYEQEKFDQNTEIGQKQDEKPDKQPIPNQRNYETEFCEQAKYELDNCERENYEQGNCEQVNYETEYEPEHCEQENFEQEKCEQENCEQEHSEQENCEQENYKQEDCEQINYKTEYEPEHCEQKNFEQKKCEPEKCEQENCEQEHSEQENCEQENYDQQNYEQEDCEQVNYETEYEPEHCEQENCEQEHSEQEHSEQENCEHENHEHQNYEQEDCEQVNYETEYEPEHCEQKHFEQEKCEQENCKQEHCEQENSKQEKSEQENSKQEKSEHKNYEQENWEQENNSLQFFDSLKDILYVKCDETLCNQKKNGEQSNYEVDMTSYRELTYTTGNSQNYEQEKCDQNAEIGQKQDEKPDKQHEHSEQEHSEEENCEQESYEQENCEQEDCEQGNYEIEYEPEHCEQENFEQEKCEQENSQQEYSEQENCEQENNSLQFFDSLKDILYVKCDETLCNQKKNGEQSNYEVDMTSYRELTYTTGNSQNYEHENYGQENSEQENYGQENSEQENCEQVSNSLEFVDSLEDIHYVESDETLCSQKKSDEQSIYEVNMTSYQVLTYITRNSQTSNTVIPPEKEQNCELNKNSPQPTYRWKHTQTAMSGEKNKTKYTASKISQQHRSEVDNKYSVETIKSSSSELEPIRSLSEQIWEANSSAAVSYQCQSKKSSYMATPVAEPKRTVPRIASCKVHSVPKRSSCPSNKTMEDISKTTQNTLSECITNASKIIKTYEEKLAEIDEYIQSDASVQKLLKKMPHRF